MDRFYRAVRLLSIVAIALGVLVAGYTFYSIWPSLRFSNMETTPQLTGLSVMGFQTLWKLSTMLGPSACIMGIVLAWLDHRKVWFTALFIVTFATNLAPAIAYALVNLFPYWQYHLDFSAESSAIYVMIEALAPLIAVVLTLLFTRTTQGPVMVDADLSLTRSAI